MTIAPGLETLTFEFGDANPAGDFATVLVGVA